MTWDDLPVGVLLVSVCGNYTYIKLDKDKHHACLVGDGIELMGVGGMHGDTVTFRGNSWGDTGLFPAEYLF